MSNHYLYAVPPTWLDKDRLRSYADVVGRESCSTMRHRKDDDIRGSAILQQRYLNHSLGAGIGSVDGGGTGDGL